MCKTNNASLSLDDVPHSSIGRNDSKKQGGTGKVSFNRFSVFVKSGGENYILGKVNANIQVGVTDNHFEFGSADFQCQVSLCLK